MWITSENWFLNWQAKRYAWMTHWVRSGGVTMLWSKFCKMKTVISLNIKRILQLIDTFKGGRYHRHSWREYKKKLIPGRNLHQIGKLFTFRSFYFKMLLIDIKLLISLSRFPTPGYVSWCYLVVVRKISRWFTPSLGDIYSFATLDQLEKWCVC